MFKCPSVNGGRLGLALPTSISILSGPEMPLCTYDADFPTQLCDQVLNPFVIWNSTVSYPICLSETYPETLPNSE